MVLNKKGKNWANKGTATYIDDVAYRLYLDDVYTNIVKKYQISFMTSYYNNNRFNKYYLLSYIITRKEKIEKIKKKIQKK